MKTKPTKTEMKVIPAVDVKDGECVQLVQGEEGTGESYGDPLDSARHWLEEDAEALHVVDLDGAIDGERENADVIEEIASWDVEVQVGGGVRSEDDAAALFDAGVDRVIMGTAAQEDPDVVLRAAEHGDVMVSLDARDGEVVVEGWKRSTGTSPVEVAGEFEALGASSILFTNVDDEGLLEGVQTDPVAELVDSVDIPVVASGGVTTVDDVRALAEAGAWGVVIGTAFYEGHLTLKQAMEAAR